MDLSKATAVIRPRSAWEAMDLGIRFVQRDFFSLVARWLICTTPWAIAAFLAGHWLGSALWAYLLFWWMKPAFDRVPLEFMSRRLFSGDVGQTNLWHLCIRLPFSAAAWRHLTYLRFSLTRAFTLPVYQLEGQTAATRKLRIQTIVARDYGAAAWLSMTLFCVAIVAHLTLSAFLLSLWQPLQPWDTPATVFDQYLSLWDSYPGIITYLDFLTFYLVQTIVELFYVGAGFALYLNRRTHLEAWDIELAFRRLAVRLGSVGRVLLLPVIVIFAMTHPAVDALAQSSESIADPELLSQEAVIEAQREADRLTVKSIINGEEFGTLETRKKWQKKPPEEPSPENDDDGNPQDDNARDRTADELSDFVVRAIKYMIIALFAGLLITWVVRNKHLFFAVGATSDLPRHERQEIGGEAVTAKFTPDPDVPEKVLRIWKRGKHREALSYLYRSALAFLTTRHSLVIDDSATEGEVLAMVQASADAGADVDEYFAAITRTWKNLAYGQHTPSGAKVAMLCADWPRISQAPDEG